MGVNRSKRKRPGLFPTFFKTIVCIRDCLGPPPWSAYSHETGSSQLRRFLGSRVISSQITKPDIEEVRFSIVHESISRSLGFSLFRYDRLASLGKHMPMEIIVAYCLRSMGTSRHYDSSRKSIAKKTSQVEGISSTLSFPS